MVLYKTSLVDFIPDSFDSGSGLYFSGMLNLTAD